MLEEHGCGMIAVFNFRKKTTSPTCVCLWGNDPSMDKVSSYYQYTVSPGRIYSLWMWKVQRGQTNLAGGDVKSDSVHSRRFTDFYCLFFAVHGDCCQQNIIVSAPTQSQDKPLAETVADGDHATCHLRST